PAIAAWASAGVRTGRPLGLFRRGSEDRGHHRPGPWALAHRAGAAADLGPQLDRRAHRHTKAPGLCNGWVLPGTAPRAAWAWGRRPLEASVHDTGDMRRASAGAQLVTLWIGPELTFLERACLRSVIRHNHSVALYCYEPPAGVPDEVELRDARAILPEGSIIRHRDGSPSLFSNRFRYELQRQAMGVWIDCDLYFVAPLGEQPDCI